MKPRFKGLPFFVTLVLSDASGPRSEGRSASELSLIFADPLLRGADPSAVSARRTSEHSHRGARGPLEWPLEWPLKLHRRRRQKRRQNRRQNQHWNCAEIGAPNPPPHRSPEVRRNRRRNCAESAPASGQLGCRGPSCVVWTLANLSKDSPHMDFGRIFWPNFGRIFGRVPIRFWPTFWPHF